MLTRANADLKYNFKPEIEKLNWTLRRLIGTPAASDGGSYNAFDGSYTWEG